ncbi:MAG: glycosyltransferase [Nitrospirae bacterium]|nr:glycosyltransferase [Nitrospirota bacterium]
MRQEAQLPIISIIIPTYNSEFIIGMCIKAIRDQTYPVEKVEIIVVDNESKDRTQSIAVSMGATVINVGGNPPQACKQRNLGAISAKGDYLYFLDHDMELSKDLLIDLSNNIRSAKGKIDAWYVPEKIYSYNNAWKNIRTFERSFYNATVIDAVRVIKKEVFFKTDMYDESLSAGPADWDMDNQLKLHKYSLGIINSCVYHHEERLTIIKYIYKKSTYVGGIDVYKNKWISIDKNVFEHVIKKQFDPYYRIIGVFIEKGKWKKIILNLHLFIPMIMIRAIIGAMYILKK